MIQAAAGCFEEWKAGAARLLADRADPREVSWTHPSEPDLFGLPAAPKPQTLFPGGNLQAPEAFLKKAAFVSLHRSPERWHLLYRVLWRLRFETSNLLKIETDDDVRKLLLMEKAVSRDMHKMKAFVRFRRIVKEGLEIYIAFHRPDHRIAEAVSPFFIERFKNMNWIIVTPDASILWNGEELKTGKGMPELRKIEDPVEELWKSYYASVFNPSRLKIKAMKKELPVRYWKNLPEAELIPELIAQAEERMAAMIESQPESARDYMPSVLDWNLLKQAAMACKGCPLYKDASQTVFGEGPLAAQTVFVGEAPGDQEDKCGRPFTGPAGSLLNKAIEEAGLSRAGIYMTNAVKHFRFINKGSYRLHRNPSGLHINACRPWLEAELAVIKPRIIVALGRTAAQSLTGRSVILEKERGKLFQHRFAERLLITMHPSAVLRMTDSRGPFEELVKDLSLARNFLEEKKPGSP